MARHNVWFGTQEYMTWVPAPAVNVSYKNNKFRQSGTYLDGGAYSFESNVGARSVELTWPPMPEKELDILRAFFDGVYGPGPFYYADPFAENNILPPWLSQPALQGGYDIDTNEYRDGSNAGLLGELFSSTVQTVTPVDNRHPVKRLNFKPMFVATAAQGPVWRFPVPPGYGVAVGMRGSLAAGVNIKVGSDVSSVFNYVLPTTGTTRTSGTAAMVGGSPFVEFQLVSASGAGPSYISSLSACLTKQGQPPMQGDYQPGKGFGGLALTSDPQITGYSKAIDSVGMSVSLIEVGPWLTT